MSAALAERPVLTEAQRAERYGWYLRALNEVAAGRVPELPSRDAQPGYFRSRRNEPVEVRIDEDGDLHGRVGTGAWHCSLDADWDAWCDRVFSSACRQPVTREAFDAVIAGSPWPDVDAFVHANPPPRAGIGHNSAPMGVEVFADQADAAVSGAGAYAEIADDETAARAQSPRSRLTGLQSEGRKLRDDDEKPLKDAYEELHAKWMEPLNKLTEAAKVIREALSAWETKKARAEREARDAAKVASPEAARVLEAASAPVKRQIRGGPGRAAAVKTVFIAKVIDQDAAYAALKASPIHGEKLATTIRELAQKVISAGGTLPGVESEEQRKVS